LGMGDCALAQHPNPQSPIPNPQSPKKDLYFLKYIKNYIIPGNN